MKLSVGRRVFAPTWLPSLVTIALLPGLISLGFWQLRRADEKRELMTQAEQGRQQTVELNTATAGQLQRYQQVHVYGHYDSAHQILLDNMPSSNGQPGYRVLTPLLLNDQTVVMVARGWVSLGRKRKQLPQLSVTEQLRDVSGMLDELPQPGVRAGDAGIQATVWPQVLNYPTSTELQQLYGASLLPRVVLLDADQADGFERRWQIDVGFTPERHVGYAVQWFGLALTLLIIYVVVNLKRVESK
ncbi:MAG: SURF1 family protein [Steroidobacteraceae bacterium]